MITPSSFTDHSSSGWTTLPTWLRYLFHLRFNISPPNKDQDFYSEKNKIILVCDCFSAHFAKEALQYAQSLNIEIVKIPEGMTGQLQPLDCRIFGVLKNESRSFLNTKIRKEITEIFKITKEDQKVTVKLIDDVSPSKPMTKQDAVAFLENSWSRVTTDLINEAWNESIFSKINDQSVREFPTINIDEKIMAKYIEKQSKEKELLTKQYLERQLDKKKRSKWQLQKPS